MAVHKGSPSLKRRLNERKRGRTPEMEFPRPALRYKCKCSDGWRAFIHVNGGHDPADWKTHENICPIFQAESLTVEVY